MLIEPYLRAPLVTLVALCFLFGATTVMSDNAAANNEPIIGAGAHFSWIVFDELKQELEQTYGRKLELYGQGSLMGVGCNAGIKSAQKSTTEKESFGFICCPLSDEEIAEKNIVVHPIALEPVLTIVNKANPVTNLSSDQVRAIFKGDITNWKEVGGEDKAIIVVARLHCKNRPGHWKKILPSDKAFTQKRLDVKSAGAMVEQINNLPNAIGHIGSAWRYKKDDKVKFLKIDNVAATPENLKQKKYPFYRQLSAITGQNPSPILLKIIRHAQTSNTFRKIANTYNLLPLVNP